MKKKLEKGALKEACKEAWKEALQEAAKEDLKEALREASNRSLKKKLCEEALQEAYNLHLHYTPYTSGDFLNWFRKSIHRFDRFAALNSKPPLLGLFAGII